MKVGNRNETPQQSDVYGTIAEHVGIQRREVAGVFHVMGLADQSRPVQERFWRLRVPGLMRGHGQAADPRPKPARESTPSPRERMMFKAKPARNVVRVRPLAGLKALV